MAPGCPRNGSRLIPAALRSLPVEAEDPPEPGGRRDDRTDRPPEPDDNSCKSCSYKQTGKEVRRIEYQELI